jgi:WD40 repeat protein
MQVSAEGGETLPIEVPFRFDGASDISPHRPELLIAGPPLSHPGSGLWLLPVPGGQARRIGNIMVEDATLTPDGTALYYSTGPDIFRANSDGSQPRKILTTKDLPFWLRISPDGHLLRFSVLDRKFRTTTLWEAQPDGSQLRQLFADWNSATNECCGNWTRDGKYFIFQATSDGVANLWAERMKGDWWRKVSEEPVQLTVGQMNSEAPLPNKDGTKVFLYRRHASRRTGSV